MVVGQANEEFTSDSMSQGGSLDNEKRLQEARQYWDNAAASFDGEPDHGLYDLQMLHAWTELLRTWLPANKIAILDVGCGTGSLSVVLAGLGHSVTGIDVSPAMITRAQAKANTLGYSIEVHVMDAAAPQFAPRSFDVIVCRHLLWTLPEPSQVLRRWVELLVPSGRLILIEGYWNTGGGLHAHELLAVLPSSVTTVSVRNLSDQPEYWGKKVTDERYAIIADLHP
jgi:2-polyprenyl-3-methyl-5-hydroxy-6-metoxy-1,4-benzoquinol methylase